MQKFRFLMLFLLLSTFIHVEIYSAQGFVRFYNNTKEMVLEIQTNTDKSKSLQFNESRKYVNGRESSSKWETSTQYDKMRTLEPGQAWEIKVEGTGGAPDIKPTIKVYWNNKDDKNYRGTYRWDDKINVKNNDLTRVFFKYDKKQDIRLGRSVRKPVGKKSGEWPGVNKDEGSEENYWEKHGSMGAIELVNNCNDDLVVKYIFSGGKAWISRNINKGKSRYYPVIDDKDIKDMQVYLKSDKLKIFSWSKNIKIKPGKKSEISFKKDGDEIKRKIDNEKWKEGEPVFDNRVVIINDTNIDFKVFIGEDPAKILKSEIATVGAIISPPSKINIQKNSVWATKNIFQENKNQNIDNILKDLFGNDIKGLLLLSHIKGDRYYIVNFQDFMTYRDKDFQNFLGNKPKIEIDKDKTTYIKILKDSDNNIKLYVTRPIKEEN
ncbi:MAG: hypothetical protein ABIF12_03450 [bacterium]